MEFVLNLLQGGLGNLAAYLAAHVLLCLVPAFYIAGAMTALIPKESITRFLGRNTPKFISYPAAALAGSLLAVCSCTIVPLFAGIYKKGAGLGPAITFLFFAPAANILALVYTGGLIGPDLAFARLFLSLAFGIGIGLIMAFIFSRADAAHDTATDALFAGQGRKGMRPAALAFLLILVALLLAGTLKLGFLTGSYAQVTLPGGGAAHLQAGLDQLIPHDASRGEEGVTVQGLILIGLLTLIGIASWKGLENIHERFSRWTWVSIGLVGLTLLIAALGMQATPQGLILKLTGKFIAVLIALAALVYIAARHLTEDDLRDFLWESWRFVKQIFPLLVAGVFVVGLLRVIIRPEWIETLAGKNTITGNLAGVLFGVFMYFPTLVEVPIAKDVPQPGDAPRAAAGLSDGRPGAVAAVHPDHLDHHRQVQGLGLCWLGGLVLHPGRVDLWGLGRRCQRVRIDPLHPGCAGVAGGWVMVGHPPSNPPASDKLVQGLRFKDFLRVLCDLSGFTVID